MSFLGEFARYIHVTFGAIGLLAFWIPIFTRKGATNHVRYGKVFVWSAYIVLSAAALTLLTRLIGFAVAGTGPADEPILFAFIVFLGYLTFVTYVIVRYGMQVLQHKGHPAELQSAVTTGLAYAAIAASVAIIGYAIIYSPPNKILLYALSPIGVGNAYGQLRYMRSKADSKRAWMYEHLAAMLAAGIAFHTAFAVFGAARLFDIGLTGWVAVIPWIAPTIVGIPAITLWTRHYQRKFGELA